jgi:hypothetical protein
MQPIAAVAGCSVDRSGVPVQSQARSLDLGVDCLLGELLEFGERLLGGLLLRPMPCVG